MKNLFLFLVLFVSNISIACSCISYGREKSLDVAETVFSGKIISKKIFSPRELQNPSFTTTMIRYTVAIFEVYKGKIQTKTLEIYSEADGASCGYLFQVGKKYTIYTFAKNGIESDESKLKKMLYTNACTRTKLFDQTESKEIKSICKTKGYS